MPELASVDVLERRDANPVEPIQMWHSRRSCTASVAWSAELRGCGGCGVDAVTARMLVTAGAVILVAAHTLATDKGAIRVQLYSDYLDRAGPTVRGGELDRGAVRLRGGPLLRRPARFARHRLSLDAPIFVLAMMLTTTVVIRLRPDPVIALLYGTGLGMLGAGIITIAKAYVDKGLAALGLPVEGDEKPPPAA